MRPLALIARLLLALSLPAVARANGRFPAANQLVPSPSDPSTLVLRTTFGVLVSHDGGTTWDWVCESAAGYGGIQDPAIAVTASHAILLGALEGLAVSPDTGCSWSFASVDPRFAIDLVVRPNAPNTVLALTTVPVDGGAAYRTQIFQSTDNGASWSPLGAPLDPAAVVETIEVAKSDPHRLYVSASKGVGASAQGALYVSFDDGAHWTERAIPLDPNTERAPFIAAVDPNDADRVYVRTSGPTTNRLFVTDDAGEHFTTAWTGGNMLGFALSPDGSKVYLGGPYDGLLVASRDTLSFVKTSSVAVLCLATRDTTLFVCSNEVSGFVLGTSTDDGAHIADRLHLWTVHGPLACPAGSSATICAAEWPSMRAQLGIRDDAGVPDAGKPAAPPASDSGCGCRAHPARGLWGAMAFGVLWGIVMLRRKRRA